MDSLMEALGYTRVKRSDIVSEAIDHAEHLVVLLDEVMKMDEAYPTYELDELRHMLSWKIDRLLIVLEKVVENELYG